MRPAYLLVFIGHIMLLSCSTPVVALMASEKTDAFCGPACLLAVCRKWHVATDLQELTTLSECDREGGVTLAGLDKAARAKGLASVGVKVSLDEVAAYPECILIAHLWGDHYVLVESTPLGLTALSPKAGNEGAFEQIPVEILKRTYSGFGLLLARERKALPVTSVTTGPDVRADQLVYNFGTAKSGVRVEYVFTLSNAGLADLVISKVDTSCGCTAAILSDKRIPPGGEAVVHVALDTSGRRNRQYESVSIHSNDPVTPELRLAITGAVEGGEPFSLTRMGVDFGSLRRDETRTKRLAVRDEAFRGLQITGVDCSTQLVSARLEYHKSETTCNPSYYVVSLTLQAHPTPAEWRACGGRLTGTVTLHTNLPEAPQIEIPFGAEVRGDLRAEPRTVFLGMLAPTQCKRMTVRIVSETGRAFRVTGGTSSSSLVGVSTAPAEAASSATSLAVTARGAGKPERLEGTITVHTDDAYQPTLTIPFYRMVSA